MFELIFRSWWHHVTSDRAYTMINIAGLAIGLAGSLAVAIYLDHELRYDQHYPDSERLVRLSAVVTETATGDHHEPETESHGHERTHREVRNAGLTGRIYDQLEGLPQVELSGRIFPTSGTARVLVGQDSSNQLGVVRADPEVLELFEPTFLAGNPRTAFADSNSAVLVASLATQLFGNEDPIGRTIDVYRSGELTVTGIIEDFPQNSHLAIRLLIPMSNMPPDFPLFRMWNHHYVHTYVRVTPGTAVDDLRPELRRLVQRIAPPEIAESLVVEPIAVEDIHLRSDFVREMKPQGTADTVFLFLAIAAVVLLVACINFTNLATARSARRAREIGLKLAFGVSRARIIAELLVESTLFSILAVGVALALVPVLLPEVSSLAGVDLTFDLLARPEWIVGLAGLALLVGLIAGIYPAFYISAFRPATTLRGEVERGRGGTRIRDALVVAQFAVAVVLIAVAATTSRQIRWALDFDLGFDTEHVVSLSNVDDAEIDHETFASLLLQNPYVRSVTATSDRLGDHWPRSAEVWLRDDPERRMTPSLLGAAPGFAAASGAEVIAGRQRSAEHGEDRGTARGLERGEVPLSVLISRTAAARLGLTPEQAVGRELRQNRELTYSVVGVIEDLYLASVLEPMQPLVVFDDPSNYNVVSIAVASDNLAATLAFIDRTWNAMSPRMPILRSFLEQDLELLYQRETRQIVLFERFALLALFVACLGLLGLATYATEQRVREIGVRKVFGASALDILILLNRGFMARVALGAVLATPLVFWFTQTWLERFAYSIEPGWREISVGVTIPAVVALVVVSSRALSAAAARPSSSLRHE